MNRAAVRATHLGQTAVRIAGASSGAWLACSYRSAAGDGDRLHGSARPSSRAGCGCRASAAAADAIRADPVQPAIAGAADAAQARAVHLGHHLQTRGPLELDLGDRAGTL